MEGMKNKVSTEKAKEYNQTFYNKNKNIDIICNVCELPYKYYNKSHHNKSKIHNILSIKLKDNITPEIKQNLFCSIKDKNSYIEWLKLKDNII